MSNPHKGRTGLDRQMHGTGHSIAGLTTAYRVLLGSKLLVLIVELLNSGIEAAIDRVSFELHDLSRRAKDFASAAVFLSLALCTGIWPAALWQRFF